MLESLFDEVAGLRALLNRDSNAGAFMLNLQNFEEHQFLKNTSSGCFYELAMYGCFLLRLVAALLLMGEY